MDLERSCVNAKGSIAKSTTEAPPTAEDGAHIAAVSLEASVVTSNANASPDTKIETCHPAEETPLTKAPDISTTAGVDPAIVHPPVASQTDSTGTAATSAPNPEDQPFQSGTDAKQGVSTEASDGHQSSAERNIWSAFNPIWSSFRVRKPRLPKESDIKANWAGTAGIPDELSLFLGLNNPVNRA